MASAPMPKDRIVAFSDAVMAMMLMRWHAMRAHLFTEGWVAHYHGPSQSVARPGS
jgi:hypothetical protein